MPYARYWQVSLLKRSQFECQREVWCCGILRITLRSKIRYCVE